MANGEDRMTKDQARPNGARAEARWMIGNGRRSFDGREVQVLAAAAAEIGDGPQDKTDERILEIAARQAWYPPTADPLPPVPASAIKRKAELAAAAAALEGPFRAAKDKWLLAHDAARGKPGNVPLNDRLQEAAREMQYAEDVFTRARARANDYERSCKEWQTTRAHQLSVEARAKTAEVK